MHEKINTFLVDINFNQQADYTPIYLAAHFT